MLSNNFVMVVCVAGTVSAEKIRDALAKIHLRHPALAPNGAADLFSLTVQTGCADDAWIEVTKAELGTPFPDGSVARARFHLLGRTAGFDLLACFDHGQAEGMSGIFVLRDVLQWVEDPASSFSVIPAQPGMRSFIPQDILNAPRFRFKLGLGMSLIRAYLSFLKFRERLLPQSAPGLAGTWATGMGLPLSSQFVVLPTSLTEEQTAMLAARCKVEKVTVHAAICVALVRALVAEKVLADKVLAEKTADKSQGKTESGMVSCPVDLRPRFSSPVAETAGRYMTLVEVSIQCRADQNFWEVARQFKKQFDEKIHPEHLFFRPVMFLKILESMPIDDIRTLLLAIFGRAVKHDYSISNLGRVALPERIGSLQMQAFYAMVNSSALERTVVVSTLGGKMTMCFLFRKSMMDAQAGRRLMDRAVLLLSDAAHAP